MTSGSEWSIWTFGTLTNHAKPVIDFFAISVRVFPVGIHSHTLGVTPPRGIPIRGFLPYTWIRLAGEWRAKDITSLANDIGAIFGRGAQSWRNRYIVADMTQDAVNRRMHAKGFSDNGVEHGKCSQLLETESSEFAIGSAKVFNLFLI